MLSRIANFDDADPLRLEPSVDFMFVPPGKPIPQDADVILLFGTKSTVAEMTFIRNQGWDHDIISHARHGGRILGICGGYQLLGETITDAIGVDGVTGSYAGLGLLSVQTKMNSTKVAEPFNGQCALTSSKVRGYEIHVGETKGVDASRPMLMINGRAEGARSISGKIEGTYVHGLLANHEYRREWLERATLQNIDSINYKESVNNALEKLTDVVEKALDVDYLLDQAQ